MQGRIAPANAEWIAEAGQMIRSGALVAFPTETVYGLGADATNGEAVARVFAAKSRPTFNPLIVHVLGLEQADHHRHVFAGARRLTDAFWPGPLTLVVPRTPTPMSAISSPPGLPTVAIRSPIILSRERCLRRPAPARRAVSQPVRPRQRDPRRACRGGPRR